MSALASCNLDFPETVASVTEISGSSFFLLLFFFGFSPFFPLSLFVLSFYLQVAYGSCHCASLSMALQGPTSLTLRGPREREQRMFAGSLHAIVRRAHMHARTGKHVTFHGFTRSPMWNDWTGCRLTRRAARSIPPSPRVTWVGGVQTLWTCELTRCHF